MRWNVIVRTGALLFGVAAVVCGAVWSVAPYRDAVALRHARLCPGDVPTPAPAAHGCVAREIGRVTGRRTYEDATSDAGGTTTKWTHYEVTYRRASGVRETREVVPAVYDAAASHPRAELDTWRGAVVRITVSGRADGFDPPSAGALGRSALLAWAGLGLLVWFLLGDGTLRHLFGNLGLRPVGWLGSGVVSGLAVHVVQSYRLSTGDYAFGALLWLLFLASAAGCVFSGGRRADSLAQVALRRRRHCGPPRRRAAV
ncbi:hypothetical protein [Streptomyces sp. NPDC058291]|uniref:hypothetical protein n=1 Tax=Streptomyces sp. NPDC058291 TaxID=3346427 RepID=UPI0036EFB7A0